MKPDVLHGQASKPRREPWLGLATLAVLLLANLTCDALDPLTGPRHPEVTISVAGDSVVALAGTLRLTAAVRSGPDAVSGVRIAWRSRAGPVAQVDSTGLVTGATRGTTTIVAEVVSPDFPAGGPKDSITVQVRFARLKLVPDTGTLTAIGDTLRLVAHGIDARDSDAGATSAVWASSDTTVVRVTPNGEAIALRPGTATLTAAADGLTIGADFAVRQIAARITLSDTLVVLDALQRDTVNRATAYDRRNNIISGAAFKWRSSRPSVIQVVDSIGGRFRALVADTATVRAYRDTSSSRSSVRVAQTVSAITITPKPLAAKALNDTIQLAARVLDPNGQEISGRRLQWVSRDSNVVTVDSLGRLVARGRGATRVIVSIGTVADSGDVSVSQDPARVVVTPSEKVFLALGDTARLSAAVTDGRGTAISGFQITWSSSDPAVATVDTAGLVRAVREGTASISAKADTVTSSATIQVRIPARVVITPATPSLDAISDTVTLRAAVKDGSGQDIQGVAVQWSSADTAVAVVSTTGTVTSRKVSATYVMARTATLRDSVLFTVTQVVALVSVSPATRLFNALQDTARFSATPRDRRGTLVPGRSVRWSSSADSVAVVDSATGLVRAVGNGSATIRAKVDTATGPASVTVSQSVAGIDVKADTATLLQVGATRSFTVTAIDGRGNLVSVTALSFTWSSNNTSVLTVSPTSGTSTVATAQAFGSAYVVAASGTGHRDSSRVLVTPLYGAVTLVRDTATLSALTDTVRLGVTATDTLGSTIASPLLSWTSADTSIATVAQSGTVTARKAGAALIVVSGGTRLDTATISVRQEPVGIRFTRYPDDSNLQAFGDTVRAAVEAYDRRGYGIPALTDSIRWRTNTPGIISVDSLSGLFTARGRGPDNFSCCAYVSYGYTYWSAQARGFSTGNNYIQVYPRVRTVVLTPDSLRPTRLRTDTLLAVFRDRNGSWSQTLTSLNGASALSVQSLDTAVAVVSTLDSARVLVTGRRAGTARIVAQVTQSQYQDTATALRRLADTTVVVVSPVVASLLVSPDSILLALGDRIALSATARDSGTTTIPGQRVSWTSTNPDVARVDSLGVVSGFEAGTARVIGSVGGVADTAVVVVRNLAVVHVDGSYTGTSSDGTASQPFKTISAAIAVARPGDVVRVHGGTYTETVVITQRLRLWGDSAATTTIRAAQGDDGIRIETADTVELRGLSVTGATYQGINVIGSGGGPLLTIEGVVSYANTQRGLSVARFASLTVRRSAFRNNGQEGVRLADRTAVARLTDVLVEGNAGYGVALQRARAEFTRLTVGSTGPRAGDRSYNGSALVALDASELRITESTFRSDNASSSYALVLDGGSRLTALTGSTIATAYQVYVTGSSGVDSLVGNTFTSSQCCSITNQINSSYTGQAALVVRNNTFAVESYGLRYNGSAPAVLEDNTFRGRYYPIELRWDSSGTGAKVTVRGNRITQSSSYSSGRLLTVYRPALIVGNEFRAIDNYAVYYQANSPVRIDSNQVYNTSSSSSYDGIYVSTDQADTVRFNRISGPWARGIHTEGSGAALIRRNTLDSVQGAVNLSSAQVVVDSNVIRNGQFGVQLRSSGCTLSSCRVVTNSLTRLTDFGLKATQVGAQVTATGNWWGATSGPRDEENTGLGFNPAGTGVQAIDAATGAGQVLYEPWLGVEPEGGSPLVVPGSVTSVAIVEPVGAALTVSSLGDSLQLRAQARDAAGLLIAGASFSWSSNNAAVATVSGTGLLRAVRNGGATITASAGGLEATLSVTVRQVVAQVDVQPDTATLTSLGGTRAFRAVVRDARGSAVDTSLYGLTWSSSDGAVLTVAQGTDSGAVATGAGYGVAYVRAAAANGVADSSRVLVTPIYSSLVLDRDSALLAAVGDTVRFTATARDAAGALVGSPLLTWTSGDTGIVAVSQTGLVTARKNGTALITVSGGLKSDTAQVRVSQVATALVITSQSRPDTLGLEALNDTIQLAAEVRDARGAALPGLTASWRTADTAVVSLTSAGRLITRQTGTARLLASYQSFADTLWLLVSQRVVQITLSPASKTFAALTDTLSFAATLRDRKGTLVAGRTPRWSLSDTTVATMDSLTGRVTSRRNGSATLRASADTATGTAALLVSQIIGAVDAQPDTATILQLGDSSRVFSVVVRDPRGQLVDSTRYSIAWSAAPSTVLTVSPATGRTTRARSVSYGTAGVVAAVTYTTTGAVFRDTSRVLVTPLYGAVTLVRDTATLTALTDTVRLSVTATDTLGSTIASPLLSWTSADTSIATVAQSGTVTARKAGAARIVVSGGTRLDTATITVRQEPVGIRITRYPDYNANLRAFGDTMRAAVEAYDRRNYAIPALTDSIRWRTNTPGIISVDSLSGLFTARGRGPDNSSCCANYSYGYTYWSAQARGFSTGNNYIQVTPRVRTVVLTPDSLRPTRLRTDTLQAVFRDRNGSWSQTLTSLNGAGALSVQSVDTAVAVVTTLDSARVLVTGRRAGTARIMVQVTQSQYQDTATALRKLVDTTVVVVSPVVASLLVSPDSILLAVGDRIALSATARDSGLTTIPGQRVTWTSADTAVATVDTLGRVTARAVGTTTMTGTAGSVSATVRVVVQNLTVVYVEAGYTGTSTGTASQPFKTIAAGLAAVDTGGVVRVRGGTYNETVVITKRLRLWGDSAATTIIRAALGNDGIRIETSDTVDVRGVTVAGPTSGSNYDGINAAGDTAGVRLTVSRVVIRNQVGRGLNAVRPQSLNVFSTTIRNNGQEGIRLLRASNAVTLADVLVESNAGNGVLVQRSRARLTRVTIGATSARSGDTRSYNGSALVALDSSELRITESTLRSDNASGYYGLVLDGGSRLTALTGSTIATAYQLNVTGSSGIDSLVGNTFASTQCCGYTNQINSSYSGQAALVIRGNTISSEYLGLSYSGSAPVVLESNTFRGRYYPVELRGGAAATVRGNQFVQSSSGGGQQLTVYRPATIVDNEFQAIDNYAIYYAANSPVRIDSNRVHSTGSSAYAIYLSTNAADTIRFNRISGPWVRGVYTDGSGAALIRRNTLDSVQGALDLSSAQVVMDSNVIRNGQFGVQLRSSGCTLSSCRVVTNSMANLTDFGVKATSTSAQVAATGNWWGSASGPRDDDDSGFDFNPAGTGVRVLDGTSGSGRVSYRPWLTAEPSSVGTPLAAPRPLLARFLRDDAVVSITSQPQQR